MKYQAMRKRTGALALCLCVLLNLLIANAAAAEPSQVTVELRPSVTIVVDGAERTFYDVTGKEVHTIYYNGTHYLPVRAIGELMGKNVNWDGSTKTITLSSPRTAASAAGTPDTAAKDAMITVEQRPDISIVVDGVQRSFTDAQGGAVYPLLNSGTNYLPVRAIGELMGKSVSWNSQTRTITLSGSSDPVVTDADTFGPAEAAPSASGTTVLIGETAAKNAALAHAGLTTAQATFVKCKLEWEDGRQIYEVEFYTAGWEYDYEIDACTGAVLSADCDAEDHTPSGSAAGVYISEEQVRSIALNRVPGAAASHITRIELDREDGEYEVGILYNGIAHEFEINACTGAICSWESVHHSESHHAHGH